MYGVCDLHATLMQLIHNVLLMTPLSSDPEGKSVP